MGLKAAVMPTAAALVSSNALRRFRHRLAATRRAITRRRPTAVVYLRLGDPYSHVLVAALDSIASRFDIELDLRVVASLPEEMTPDRERLEAWARRDAASIAALYDFDVAIPASVPSVEQTAAAAMAATDGLAALTDLFDRVARGTDDAKDVDSKAAAEELAKNERALERGGHYMSAMIDFEGEWYWGIDRLGHLEARLIAGGRARSADDQPMFNRRLRLLATPVGDAQLDEPLVLYWSARSPYSYLVIDRVIELAEAFAVPLDIRPVLPMVMRNLSVPRTKRFYIFLDAKREAELLGVPYGRVCDPLGVGVERCYGVFDYAKSIGREVAWVREFATAVWSEGVDAASDRGIAKIAERAELDPGKALASATTTTWREWAEAHRLEMLDGGFWGVPTIRFGDTWVWGQDRLWLVEDAMRAAQAQAADG